MSHLHYFSYPGFGDYVQEKDHYSQAVRVGDRIEISSQGGWHPKIMKVNPDLNGQIDQAFVNVDIALKAAGGKGWSQVIRITTYSMEHTEEIHAAIVRNLKKWMPDHKPIWKELVVQGFGFPSVKFEIDAVAHIPKPGDGDLVEGLYMKLF